MTMQTASVGEKIALAQKSLKEGRYAPANQPGGIQTKTPNSWGPAMRK